MSCRIVSLACHFEHACNGFTSPDIGQYAPHLDFKLRHYEKYKAQFVCEIVKMKNTILYEKHNVSITTEQQQCVLTIECVCIDSSNFHSQLSQLNFFSPEIVFTSESNNNFKSRWYRGKVKSQFEWLNIIIMKCDDFLLDGAFVILNVLFVLISIDIFCTRHKFPDRSLKGEEVRHFSTQQILWSWLN